MKQKKAISLVSTPPKPAVRPVYAVRLDQGDSVDNSSTIVGITHDQEQAKAYVAHQEAVLSSIMTRYESLSPVLAEWTAANSLSHQHPDQSDEEYGRIHSNWTRGLLQCKSQWLKDNLTLEEIAMNATMDNNSWCVEPLHWLPGGRL